MKVLFTKRSVAEAGKKLVHEGYVERTWGNVSARIDENTFAVTPSGYSYDKITAHDIVVVNISGLKYSGRIKPSSESAIHASIYKLYPEVNFIIHTHQKFASILSVKRRNISAAPEEAAFLGSVIPAACYAEAGTKEIAENIVKALSAYKTKAVLMPCHGAVCFGKDSAEAFRAADCLETLSEKTLQTDYPFFKYFKDKAEQSAPLLNFHSSRRIKNTCRIFEENTGRQLCRIDIKTGNIIDGDGSFFAGLHRKIYAENSRINFIVQSVLPASVYLSKMQKVKQKDEVKNGDERIPPFFDDFSQIAGQDSIFAEFIENKAELCIEKIACALKERNTAAIYGSGALCCGATAVDAFAVRSIFEKNAAVYILSQKDSSFKPVPANAAKKMNKSYIEDYSKLMDSALS